MRIRISQVERVFVILSLLFFSDGLDLVLRGFERGGYDFDKAVAGSKQFQIIGALIYLSAFVFALRLPRRVALSIWNSPIALALVFYVTASVFWSVEAGLSFRRASSLAGTSIFALYVAYRFGPEEFVKLLTWTYGVVVVLTWIVVVAAPGLAFVEYRGESALTATYGHKNQFGRAMVVAALLMFLSARDAVRKKHRYFLYALMAAALLAIPISHSGGATLMIAATFVVFLPVYFVFSRIFRRASFPYTVTLLGGVLLGHFVGTAMFGLVLDLLGKDPTLSNRSLIWQDLIEAGMSRPWLGHGYGGFWQSAGAEAFNREWPGIGHSHNGFMDAWLDIGFVGIGLLATAILIGLHKSANAYFVTRSSSALFFVCVSIIMAAYNLIADVYPEHNSIFWVLLLYTLFNPGLAASSRAKWRRLHALYRWRGGEAMSTSKAARVLDSV